MVGVIFVIFRNGCGRLQISPTRGGLYYIIRPAPYDAGLILIWNLSISRYGDDGARDGDDAHAPHNPRASREAPCERA